MLLLFVIDLIFKCLLFEYVIEQFDQGGEKLDMFLFMGMELFFFDRLCCIQLCDLMLIVQWDLDIQVGFGDGSISVSLDCVYVICCDMELVEYFVCNGVLIEFMVMFFWIVCDDVCVLCKVFVVEVFEVVGWFKLLFIEKRELVYCDWFDIQCICFVDFMCECYFVLY